MLIVGVDRWPDGGRRIAWCASGGRDRRWRESGVQVLVAEPGQAPRSFNEIDPALVPYVVRDIAETVRFGAARSPPASREAAVAGNTAWWAAVELAAIATPGPSFAAARRRAFGAETDASGSFVRAGRFGARSFAEIVHRLFSRRGKADRV